MSLPNNQYPPHYSQQHNGRTTVPRTTDYTSYPRAKGLIYNARIGSRDLQTNLPELSVDGFSKLLISAGDIVLQRWPIDTPPRWRNIPLSIAEDMKVAFLCLPRCSEVMRCSTNPVRTREVLILVLARAVNNRRSLELRRARHGGGSRAPRIASPGANEEG